MNVRCTLLCVPVRKKNGDSCRMVMSVRCIPNSERLKSTSKERLFLEDFIVLNAHIRKKMFKSSELSS